MKYFGFYMIIIALGICCLANKYSTQSNPSMAVKAINDIIEPWYTGKTSPCANGTYKIIIGDTLTWRDFKYSSNADVSSLLDKYGVDKEPYVIASVERNNTMGIKFLKENVRFLSTLPKEPLCTQFYFSQLYTTKNENEFIIQYISYSFELTEETVLLLQFDNKRFSIKDYLSTKSVWF